MSVTADSLNARVYPIEQTVNSLARDLEEVKNLLESFKIQATVREADMQRAEQRVEEVAKKMETLEIGGRGSDHSGDSEEKPSGSFGILRNPALRNVDAYTGDHRKHAKWRSKLKFL